MLLFHRFSLGNQLKIAFATRPKLTKLFLLEKCNFHTIVWTTIKIPAKCNISNVLMASKGLNPENGVYESGVIFSHAKPSSNTMENKLNVTAMQFYMFCFVKVHLNL